MEPAVNVVIGKRFDKKQQMRRGAHMLLQIRTRILDGTLHDLFDEWHPGRAANGDNPSDQAVAA